MGVLKDCLRPQGQKIVALTLKISGLILEYVGLDPSLIIMTFEWLDWWIAVVARISVVPPV